MKTFIMLHTSTVRAALKSLSSTMSLFSLTSVANGFETVCLVLNSWEAYQYENVYGMHKFFKSKRFTKHQGDVEHIHP